MVCVSKPEKKTICVLFYNALLLTNSIYTCYQEIQINYSMRGFWSSSSSLTASIYRKRGKLLVPNSSNTTAQISSTPGVLFMIICSNTTETENIFLEHKKHFKIHASAEIKGIRLFFIECNSRISKFTRSNNKNQINFYIS